MIKHAPNNPVPADDEDPAVYSGRSPRALSPFALFMITTFWLVAAGVIVFFFSVVWGSVILAVAAITLVAALMTAG